MNANDREARNIEWVNRYTGGWSVASIAAMDSVHRSHVTRVLKRRGVSLRGYVPSDGIVPLHYCAGCRTSSLYAPCRNCNGEP